MGTQGHVRSLWNRRHQLAPEGVQQTPHVDRFEWLGLAPALALGGDVCARIAASAPRSLRSSWASEDEASTAASKQEEAWPALGDRTLVPMVEQLFSHLLKVINICAHVLDDVAPGPAVKVTPHSGSSSLSSDGAGAPRHRVFWVQPPLSGLSSPSLLPCSPFCWQPLSPRIRCADDAPRCKVTS